MELNGEYLVHYKNPNQHLNDEGFKWFIGKCENFVPTGTCVFSNNDNEMLIVRYRDIVQMRLKNRSK